MGDLCAILNICVIVGWSTRQKSDHDNDKDKDNDNHRQQQQHNNPKRTRNLEYRDMMLQSLTKKIALVPPKEEGCWSGPPPPEYQKSYEFRQTYEFTGILRVSDRWSSTVPQLVVIERCQIQARNIEICYYRPPKTNRR